MDTRLIVTDLDYTLLRNDKTISDYSSKIFKSCKEYNILTAVATARYITGIQKFSKRICPDYEITNDGTMTFSHGKLIDSSPLPLDVANNIMALIKKENPDKYISVVTPDGILRKPGKDGKCSIDSSELSESSYSDFSTPLTSAPYKIVIESDNSTLADYITKSFNCKLIVYRGEDRYAFVSKESGKANSIMRLASILNLPMSNVSAFGDDFNDIDMLKCSGTGIAVSNAIQSVKDAADYITLSNEEDGVADYINKHYFH